MGLQTPSPQPWPVPPCSQMRWFPGWSLTHWRDLGTSRNCCSQGSRGIRGHSPLGPATGKETHKTPVAPPVGPPCLLEHRSPSPGGCLGNMGSEEGAPAPPQPSGALGGHHSHTRIEGALLPLQCHFLALFQKCPQTMPSGFIMPGPPGLRPGLHIQKQESRTPCSPHSLPSSGLFTGLPGPLRPWAPISSPPNFSSRLQLLPLPSRLVFRGYLVNSVLPGFSYLP